jgi:poly-beta-1,6-N-acetyl-D-glucosamine synthase
MPVEMWLFASLESSSLIAVFWFLIFLEAPRFIIANTAIGLFHTRKARPEQDQSNIPLQVSIVLPCHNGADGITRTVHSLHEQTLTNIQVVVVDDGSTDNTFRVAERLRDCGMIDVLLSTGLRGGKSAALNLALNYCSGDIIVSADADTTFNRDGIEAVVKAFADPKVGAVGGNVGVRNSDSSLLASMQAVEYAIGISLGRKVNAFLGILPMVSGAFAAYRRQALLSVGNWEPGAGEDADLTLKLRRAGWDLSFAHRAWALTDAPSTLQALVRQRLRWERDLVRLHLRKFRMLLWPWENGFSFRDTISTIDALFFSVIMSLAFTIYLIYIVAEFGFLSIPILISTCLIYSLIGVLTYSISILHSNNPINKNLLPFAVGYGLYCIYILHPIRVWACTEELILDRSYRTVFVPKKVLDRLWRF